MAMVNIRTADFQDREAPAGFRSRRARIGSELGTESIGASIWEVPPGEAAYPYHFHLADEELVIVLSGRPSLRTPDGMRDLEEGDAVRFPLGEEGAHQLLNRTQEVVRFLAVSNSGRPDIVVYPDSDKVRAAERLPAGTAFPLLSTAGTPWTTGMARPVADSPEPRRNVELKARDGDRAQSLSRRSRTSGPTLPMSGKRSSSSGMPLGSGATI